MDSSSRGPPARLARMTKEETSGNANKVELKRKVRLAEVTKDEYSGNAGKTEPRKNAFVLSPDRKIHSPQSHHLHATCNNPLFHHVLRTTHNELRTTHRFSTGHTPLPTPHPLRHPRRAALAARSGIQTESPTRDEGAANRQHFKPQGTNSMSRRFITPPSLTGF